MFCVDGVQRLAYTSAIAGGPTLTPEDYGVVAVIDGSKSSLESCQIYADAGQSA